MKSVMNKCHSYALNLQIKEDCFNCSLRLWRILSFVFFIVSMCFSQTPAALDQEKFDRGLELYLTQGCGICHTLSKANTKGIFGPSHDGFIGVAQARFQSPDYRGEAKSADEYALESTLKPTAYIVPGYALTRFHMPAYTHLSPDDLDALVHMLLQP
jgi:mono/diheme cytochrome c family protein